jgi:hypothetical protein
MCQNMLCYYYTILRKGELRAHAQLYSVTLMQTLACEITSHSRHRLGIHFNG